MTAYGAVAKELNLSQAQAQKLIDSVAPVIQARQMSQLEAFYQDIGGLPNTWAAAMKADKDIGGEALDANLAIAAKAIDKFGGPDLRRLFDKTGLGNHPVVAKAFIAAGKALSADNFVPSGGDTGKRSLADRLYG